MYWKKEMKKNIDLLKRIIVLLCGIWALGLGGRMTVELYMSSGWVHVPRNIFYGINIWLDFLPLFIFGLITVAIKINEIRLSMYQKGKGK